MQVLRTERVCSGSHLLANRGSDSNGGLNAGQSTVPHALVHLLVHQGAGLLRQGAWATAHVQRNVAVGGALDAEALADCGTAASEEEHQADGSGQDDGKQGQVGGQQTRRALHENVMTIWTIHVLTAHALCMGNKAQQQRFSCELGLMLVVNACKAATSV